MILWSATEFGDSSSSTLPSFLTTSWSSSAVAVELIAVDMVTASGEAFLV
jgi:hypothetical protein